MAKNSNTTPRTSKGERRSSMKTASARSSGQRMLDIQKAYLAGKNPWITLPNPNKADTSRLFIRAKANDLYGDPKNRNVFMIPNA